MGSGYLHVKIAVVDLEAEIEAELLFSCQLWNVLHVLKLERVSFLFLEWPPLLLISTHCLISSSIDLHALQHI